MKTYELEVCDITHVDLASHWCWCVTQVSVCGLVHTHNYRKSDAGLYQDPHASCCQKTKLQATPWDVPTPSVHPLAALKVHNLRLELVHHHCVVQRQNGTTVTSSFAAEKSEGHFMQMYTSCKCIH